MLHAGGLTPNGVTRADQLAVRIIAGYEVGLTPVQAVNGIMIVNGRASIWGDVALALVRSSGLLESIDERVEGDGDDRAGVVTTKRKGDAEAKTTRFTVADAKKAGLFTKKGPWQDYPDRMLVMRARSWNVRDNYADVLCGLGIAEEQLDHRAEVKVGSVTENPPAIPTTTAIEGTPTVDEKTLDEIGQARPAWLRSQGVDPADTDAVRAKWREKLSVYGVTSAAQLAPDQAAQLLLEVRTLGHAQENVEVFPPLPAAGD